MNRVGLIVYPVSDLTRATALFSTALGTVPYADSPYYVGFKTDEMELGLVPKAGHRASGALAYIDVADINAALASLLAAGATTVQEVTDVAQGLLVASVNDPDGNPIGLRQAPKKDTTE